MRTVSSFFVALVSLSMVAACSRPPNANPAAGPNACPDAVKQAVAKGFPAATMSNCKAERGDGRDQFEVKLDNGGEKLEVDVAPDGKILQTEVAITLDGVPAKVMTAFTSKYPSAKPTRVERQVRAGKGTYYELVFPGDPRAREVTFSEDGSFVEEE